MAEKGKRHEVRFDAEEADWRLLKGAAALAGKKVGEYLTELVRRECPKTIAGGK